MAEIVLGVLVLFALAMLWNHRALLAALGDLFRGPGKDPRLGSTYDQVVYGDGPRKRRDEKIPRRWSWWY